MSEKVSTTIFIVLVVSFFLLPLIWLLLAPFDSEPSYRLHLSNPGLNNFKEMAQNPYAYRSLINSVVFRLALG